MSLQITGIKRLRANYYNKIMIRENPLEGCYVIDVSGDDSKMKSETVGNRFSDDFKNMSSEEKIREVINDYLSNTKICGLSDPITIANGGAYNRIYGNFGYKVMLLQLFNSKFNDISKRIKMKYYQDRFDFCYGNNGLRVYKIEASCYETSYDIALEKLHRNSEKEEYYNVLRLRSKDFKILDSEKKFIKDFIINVFSKFNEEIITEEVYNTESGLPNGEVVGYVLRCGDVKIYFPKYEPLLFINVIVYNYNLQLRQAREESKKRQLKMEEF